MITSTPAARSSFAIFDVMPVPAGDVLGVDDDEREAQALSESRQQCEQGPFADPADDVADEQDPAAPRTPGRGSVSVTGDTPPILSH